MTAIHPVSERTLASVFHEMPHALLITGPVGIGLSTITQQFTDTTKSLVVTVLPEKEGKVDIEKGTVTVESIRRLYDLMRSVEPKGRIVVIDYSERMAPVAQNAFLKLLEEPTPGNHFILLSHQPDWILPTIKSRTQRIDIRPATKEQSLTLLDELNVTDATKRAQLLFIAEGLPAELTRLSQDAEYFDRRASIVKDARSLATGSAYDRLKIANKYKNSRPDALLLMEDALRLLQLTIAKNGDPASLRMATRFESIHKRLTEQGNVRLQLSATIMV